MVIHDMRNPTNSIEFAVKEVLRLLFHAITIGSEPNQLALGEGGETITKEN
jgi:hypothetical protein